MNTKIKNITRVGYLIIVIAVFGVMQNYTSNKIVSNEIVREEHDVEILSNIQELFNNALKKTEVEDYVKKMIGNKEYHRWTLGWTKDKLSDNLQRYYELFYKNISIEDLQKIAFLSLDCKKDYTLCIYIDKNLEVTVSILNKDEEIVKGSYSDVIMTKK